MKGIVCEKPEVFKWKEQDEPKRQEGEAIVNLKRMGVCGTDLHAFKGQQPFFQYPRVLGHELAGVIESIDDNPYNLESGDQVSVIPYLECGQCVACRNGKPNCCTDMKVIGVHVDGGMCEKISVPYNHLVKTNDLTLDQSAVIEPLSIGAHAVRRSPVQKGDTVLVIGAGPIGLGVMAFLKQEGAKVIAMDISEDRLRFCRKWTQVDETIHALESPFETLKNMTNGDMPKIVMDATGNRKSMMDAFQYTANGGTLIYVGLVKSDITFFDPDFHAKEQTLMASRNATIEDFHYVKQSIKNNRINVSDYITHRCHFEDVMDTFHEWLKPENGVIKAMIEW
ncbi:zinc-binding alcohol dehydrogenase family protein [Gracilibacillus sp. YIM 98692]|uniref:zinc-binding alcohol dehydrogenase family protein n=1 Tax=Gracilibacillus sp. YIM 98692 TaxID=2663532 RepID=UPI0013D0B6AB|nr:zinc-binding alcohol dehydrogenase family protein [Gracilibacillus sp. YIM 98692]